MQASTSIHVPRPLSSRIITTDAERLETPGGRLYVTPDGCFPSVTTITKATQIPSPQLEAWKARASAEDLAEVERKRVEGSVRGNALDGMLERWALTGEQGSGPWWDAIRLALFSVTEVFGAQLTVWHGDIGYAGTIDLFATWDGRLAVIDWKTANKWKRLEWITDYLHQVAAYTKALQWMVEHGRIPAVSALGGEAPVEHGVVAIAIKGRSRPQLVDVRPNDVEQYFAGFCDRVVQHAENEAA